MKKIKKLIKLYFKHRDSEELHKLRVEARRELAKLEKVGKVDENLKKILKLSSAVRDADVLLEKCSNKKVQNYLIKKRKKAEKKLLKFLHQFNPDRREIKETEKNFSYKECQEACKKKFLQLSDKELHKTRIVIKKCRYSFDEKFKPIQIYLGEAHDYYNCIKLKKKFNLNYKKESKKKRKFVKKAYKLCKRIEK